MIDHDEITTWLRQMEKPGRDTDRGFYLTGWSGTKVWDVDRIERGDHSAIPCVSFAGGIQPGPLASLLRQLKSDESSDDGLLQRFQLLIWPDEDSTWGRVDRKINAEAAQRYERILRALLELKGVPLRFNAESQAIFNDWWDQLERRLRAKPQPMAPEVVNHLSKYRGLMPTLAALFELIQRADEGSSLVPQNDLADDNSPFTVTSKLVRIRKDCTERAIRLCSFLESHMQRVYGSLASARRQIAAGLAEKIKVGKLGKTEFTKRQIYRDKDWAGLETEDEVKDVLNFLEEMGWVRRIERRTSGRTGEVWLINPKIWQ